jgi:hypothetical protein
VCTGLWMPTPLNWLTILLCPIVKTIYALNNLKRISTALVTPSLNGVN